MRAFSATLFLFFIPLAVFSDKIIHSEDQSVWFTGALIAPSGDAVPKGHFNIEPYFYAYAFTGNYNDHWKAISSPTFWSLQWQLPVQFGMTPWMDFSFTATTSYNLCDGASHVGINDPTIGFDFQFVRQSFERGDLLPSIKFTLSEIFPLGKYQNLNPAKNNTDAMGAGSFTTLFGLTFGKLFNMPGPDHYTNLRLNLSYFYAAPTRLHGFNSYGGGYGTNVRFYPSQNFNIDFAFETTLTQNWVFSCDFIARWHSKSRFTGNPGTNSTGALAILGGPSGIQYSIAPAIEYNFGPNIGIIAGSWMSLAGRNTSQFYSGIAAINIYY